MKKSDLSILKIHCDNLKLGDKTEINFCDWVSLRDSLKNDFATERLVPYIESLRSVDELQDLLVNIVYE